MSFNFKAGGSWRSLATGYVKVAGAWQEIRSAWIKVAGVWQKVYTFEQVILTGTELAPIVDSDVEAGIARAGWRFQFVGNLTTYSGAAYPTPEWYGILGGTTHRIPDQTYYLRATLVDGSAPDISPALNVWLSLASEQLFGWTSTTGVNAGTLKIEIAKTATGDEIQDTGYYRGEAQSI